MLLLLFLELTQDSCSTTPSSKNVTLPPGCVHSGTNSSIVDVGECEPVACLKNDTKLNSSCQDPSFCCGPRDFIQALVVCGDVMSFNLSKVTTCSCGGCTEKVTVLQGIVVGGPEEEPLRYGDVIYTGEVVAYTDREGKFSFTVPAKVKRAIVTFKDSFYETFEESSKVFVINEGSSNFYKINLKRKPSPISFNASEPLDVPLGSNPNSDGFADLELPEETFLTEDGSVFRGNAKASISVTDSRNLSDVLAAPGDFSTTDEDGEEEILETFGMVKLNFQDESGKQLVMSKPMKVYLDPEKLNLTSDVPLKLYWLDKKTGRWREAGNFELEDGSKRRRKRSPRVFFVGTVTPAIAREGLNFDAPSTRVAVRVTTDPYPRSPGSAGAVVRVIRQEGGVFRGYIEKTTTAEGLVCIPIWRDKTCHIQVESNGKYMVPTRMEDLPTNIQATLQEKVQDNTGAVIKWIEFTSALDENSAASTPMYNHISTEIEQCELSQPRPEGSQFTFAEPQTVSDFSILTDIRRDSWEPNGCYIKIKVNGENAIFAAESYRENDFDETGKIGLHIRMSRTVTAGGSNIVCLQFSCPTDSAYTYVKIAPLTKTCMFRGVHRDLSNVQFPTCPINGLSRSVCATQPPAIQAQEKWLWIPQSSAAQSTFRTFSDRRMGEARCLVGNQRYGSATATTVTDLGYTLEYDCR